MNSNITNLDSLIVGNKTPVRDLSMNKLLMLKKIYGSGGGTTLSGNVISFTGSENTKIKSIDIPFSFIQSGSGDPSPSNVRNIQGITGVKVYVSPTQGVSNAIVYDDYWVYDAYAGSVDVVTGVLTLNAGFKRFTGINAEAWNLNKNHRNTAYTLSGPENSGNVLKQFSNYLVPVSPNASSVDDMQSYTFWLRADKRLYVTLDDKGTQWSSIGDFKSYLQSNNLCIVYELASPITRQLSPIEVEALVGQNYIWASNIIGAGTVVSRDNQEFSIVVK